MEAERSSPVLGFKENRSALKPKIEKEEITAKGFFLVKRQGQVCNDIILHKILHNSTVGGKTNSII